MDKQEEYILAQVQMCVDVDKDELIKALEYDRGQYEKGWSDRDNEIVRCKDCKHNCLKRVSGNAYCDLGIGLFQLYDYCSCGKRRKDADE